MRTWQLRLAGVIGFTLMGLIGAWAAPIKPLSDQAMVGSGTALTLYNENFAVVKQTIPLTLTAGLNHITYNDITYHLEPDSVILRDPTGKRTLQVQEQSYRADPVTQELLLSIFEGQTIDFQVTHDGQTTIIPGKIIRSGYVPHNTTFTYGQNIYAQQQFAEASSSEPIIEVNGKLQFTLPGMPLFPALPDDSILKPTLDWTVRTDKGGPVDAELAYVTGGMSWKAAYNVVEPPAGDVLALTGWVTMDNQSGKTFTKAHIKLMAGDVNKIQPQNQYSGGQMGGFGGSAGPAPPQVTEKTFDEYHLYTLANPTTLRDRETKQVQFVQAPRVHAKTIYVYDGEYVDPGQYYGWNGYGFDGVVPTMVV